MPAHSVASIAAPPNSLAPYYKRFRVDDRLLLTGHSHQAWPDCAEYGHALAWDDAAMWVDDKWERAYEQAAKVRAGWARLLGDHPERIALGQNTHELLVRYLSALPLKQRPRIVTTDGEFHSMRRQLDRLAEEGIELIRVPASEPDRIVARAIEALEKDPGRTATVMVSSVLFLSSRIVPELGALAEACERHGVPMLVDMYHQLNVIPTDLARMGLAGCYVVGGGYKYAQLGEGNGFLRFPEGCSLRPVVTGWFSEFSLLSSEHEDARVGYGGGPDRFAGATYDPTSHYRAAAVFEFFREQGLTPELLRDISQHQVARLAAAFDAMDLDPKRIRRDREAKLEDLGGFLALVAPRAGEIRAELRARGVMTDCRGDVLRFGPAPYLTDAQLDASMSILGEVVA